MTHIASYKSKKDFKAAVTADANRVYVDDPSMFSPVSGSVYDVAKVKGMFTVTNHPKRSWFACVKWNDGKIKVE